VHTVASVAHFAISCFCLIERAVRDPKARESFGQRQKVFSTIAMTRGSLSLQERDSQILQSRTAICEQNSGDGSLQFMGTLRSVTPCHQSIEYTLNGMVYGVFTKEFSCKR
jgi:hypothetical protein